VYRVLDGERFEDFMVGFYVAVKDIDGFEEVDDEWRCGLLDDILGGSFLFDGIVVHDGHAIG